jgi:hypothetical protein
MADIDIQEKKSSPWPWILGLIALVAVVWIAMEMLGDDDDDMAVVDPAAEQQPYAPPPADAGMTAMPDEVTRFDEECAAADATGEMTMSHEFTESCVRHMTAALEAVIRRDTVGDAALSTHMEQYRSRADQLTANRESAEHSSYVHEVFDGAAELIARIEETRENTGDALQRRAPRVQQAADAISVDEPVLEQREEVRAFFAEASSAIRAMALPR